MSDTTPNIRFSREPGDIQAAHDLFRRRIGGCLVEDSASFMISASEETADWLPRLALAELDGRLVGAQLGGLLPAVAMVSLPYTAVEEGYEGRGIYLAIKRAVLAELKGLARERELPPPTGNVSEEAPGSPQYERKVGKGIAVVLPLAYRQPGEQGLAETPLALTYEPFQPPPPRFTHAECLRIAAAVYRALYRIAGPEHHPAYQRMLS